MKDIENVARVNLPGELKSDRKTIEGYFLCLPNLHPSMAYGCNVTKRVFFLINQEFDKGKALEENMEKLAQERKRSEELLCRMMPKAIADRLKLGGKAVETCEVHMLKKQRSHK